MAERNVLAAGGDRRGPGAAWARLRGRQRPAWLAASADGRRRPPRWCRYHGRRLRSAVPAIITPLAADQPSLARVAHELGAGPTPIPFSAFTAERLATAIRQAVTDQQMRRRAAELGKQIQAEDGPGRTAKLFTQHIARTAAKKAEP